MDIKDLIEEAGYIAKRKAATHGGEYYSPCPFCKDGEDRFLIWPQRDNNNGNYNGGRYSCRRCGKYGDAITFLCQFHGFNYYDACAMLRIVPKLRNNLSVSKPAPKLHIAQDPSTLWMDKADAFIAWCHMQLMGTPHALELVISRGITLKTAERFRLGYNPTNLWREYSDWGLNPEIKDNGQQKKLWLPAGLVIPTTGVDGRIIKVKIRRRAEDIIMDEKKGRGSQKYIEITGSKKTLTLYGNISLPVALILESEFDAVLVQQEASDLVYCVALGGNTKPLDLQTDTLLKKTSKLLFCPDYDIGGATAWARWKKIFSKIERILTPFEKSAGDYFLAGGDLRQWLDETIKN